MNAFELFAKLSLDSSAFESGLRGALSAAKGIGSAIVGAVGQISSAAVGFMADAVSVNQDFESSMSQVAATLGYTMSDIRDNVDGAGDAFQALSDKAREMGGATVYSASESAEALNILAMSGFNANESIGMVEDVLHLAAAGSMDMASAAGYISGTMKGFADDTKDAGYYANLIAKGATLANTSVSQLGEAMSAGAAGASSYSQSAESMTLSLLRLAEQGEYGSAAGTALAAAMKDIYTPSVQGANALAELGVAAYKNGKALDFNEVVNNLNAALADFSEEEANAYKQTIFGIQGLAAYNKMVVTTTDTQAEWSAKLAAASDGMGEAAKQYETMTDNLAGDIAGWGSAVDEFKISISDGLMPTIREFVQFGTSGIQAITAGFKDGGFSGAIEALGKVIADGITMITEKIPEFIDAGFKLLGAIAQGITGNFPALADAAFKAIETLVGYIEENLPEIARAAKSILGSLGRYVRDNLPELMESATDLIVQFADYLIDDLPGLVRSATEMIETLANGLLKALPKLIPAAVDAVVTLVEALTDPENLSNVIDGALEIIMALVDGLIKAIPKILEAAPQIIYNLAEALMAELPKIFTVGIALVAQLALGIFEAVAGFIVEIPSIIAALVGGFEQGAADFENIGIRLIEGLWAGIKNTWDRVIGDIKGLFGGLTTKVNEFLGIHSPSKVFAEIGENMAAGIGVGFEDEFRGVKRDITSDFDFGYTASVEAGEKLSSVKSVNGLPDSTEQILEILTMYLPQLSKMSMYLDSGELIGGTAYGYDTELTKIQARKEREGFVGVAVS